MEFAGIQIGVIGGICGFNVFYSYSIVAGGFEVMS
jgi:hypothetical protein